VVAEPDPTALANAPYAGELSFARRPRTRELEGVDIAIMGIPFDLATTNRPGARFGPRAIREQSAFVGQYPWGLWPWTDNVLETCRVIDYGDLPFTVFWAAYPGRMVDAVVEHAEAIIEAGASLLSIGGDHMVSYPLLRAHAARYGPMSLVHFDAHSDTWDMGDDLNHGTMFHLAAREGLVDPSRSIQVGIRTPNPETRGFTIVHADRLATEGVGATVTEIRRVVGNHPVYLTFDIDFLDPAYAPGTGTPVIGGPTTAQARQLLWGLHGLRVLGADQVEVAPHYDVAQITALAGATIALDLVHLLAEGRQR
jgi:agmatinase